MPGVVRDGDTNITNAKVQSRVSDVLVNNRRVSVDGSEVIPHLQPPHKSSRTSRGLRNVLVNNKPINVKGNADTCGDARNSSSNDVIAG